MTAVRAHKSRIDLTGRNALGILALSVLGHPAAHAHPHSLGTPPGRHVCYRCLSTLRPGGTSAETLTRHPPCPSAFTPPPASAPLIPQRTHRLSQPPPQTRPAAVRDRGPHTHLSCRSHARSRRAERRLRRDRERVGPGRTGPGRPVSRGTHRGEGGRTAWRRDTLPGAKGGAAQPSRRPHRAAPPQRCVAAAAAPALNLSRGAWALGRRGRPGWERGREQASAGRPQRWAQPGSVRQVLPFRPRRASHSASVCSGGAGGCAPRSRRDAAPLLLPTAKPRPGRLAPCPTPCSAHLQPAFAVCPSKSALVILRVPVTCVF